MAQPSKKSVLLPIFLIVLVDILALTLIIPLLPFYAQHFGATPVQVGLLATVFSLCQLISGPILGDLSDRFGRKPVLMLSQLGTFLGFILMARATHLWMIFVARIIDGSTAGNLSIAQAYISDVTEAKDRTKAFAIIGIAFGIGFLVGPAISGVLSSYDYTYPIYGSAGLSALSIAATFFLLPRTPPARSGADRRLGLSAWTRYGELFSRPALAVPLRQFFFFCLAFSIFTSGFALFAERRFFWNGQPFGPREVGFVFAWAGFLGIIIQGGLIGRLVRRFGDERLARAGFCAAAIGYVGLAAIHDPILLLFVSAISSFGSGILRPTLTSIVSRGAHSHEQGLVLGLTQSINSISLILAPILGGVLIQYGYLTGWPLFAACVSAGGVILSFRAGVPARAVG